MRIKCYAQGKFYTIECPVGTSVLRHSENVPHDVLVVPFKGKEIRIPADPPELLPMLAETGNFGVSLVGEPEPEERLAGVVCPGCGESDLTWLQLREGSEMVLCHYCGADFAVTAATMPSVTPLR